MIGIVWVPRPSRSRTKPATSLAGKRPNTAVHTTRALRNSRKIQGGTMNFVEKFRNVFTGPNEFHSEDFIQKILSAGGERVVCPYCHHEVAAYPKPSLNGGTRCANCRETIYYDGEDVLTERDMMDNPDEVWLCPRCYRKMDEPPENGLRMCGACNEQPVRFVRSVTNTAAESK